MKGKKRKKGNLVCETCYRAHVLLDVKGYFVAFECMMMVLEERLDLWRQRPDQVPTLT
jgi:hypothetical protein